MLVRRLECLFSPPGLPLVAKAPGALPTASFVVRGGPGTGKTTLALGLALTVARGGGGRVLYLSTEIAPVDAQLKAQGLGVGPDRIASWDGADDQDELLLDHVASGAPDPSADSPEGRMSGAMDRAWERLQGVAPPGPPIRALVIDTFALVGLEGTKSLRSEVMNLLVVLEEQGISPILVEETPAPAEDWIGYLVDLRFDLGWERDRDTGAQSRSLTCSKSRYAEVVPGPHLYGRELGELAVWPALYPVVTAGHLVRLESPAFLVGAGPVTLRYVPPGAICGTTGALSNLIHSAGWLQTESLDAANPVGIARSTWQVLERLSLRAGVCEVAFPKVARARSWAAELADALYALSELGVTVVYASRHLDDPVPLTSVDDGGPLSEMIGDLTTVAVRTDEVAATVRSGALGEWPTAHSAPGFVERMCRELVHPGVKHESVVQYAALNALHLGSAPALAWLVTQGAAPGGDLARGLSIAPLARAGRTEEALNALQQVPGLAEADRERAAELIRKGPAPA